MQRSEGNEASFSLPVGGALLSRKGSREGDEVERRSSVWREKKKRREEEQRNWADTRLEKKLKYTPSLSLSRCNSISPRFHSGRHSSPRET